ncbi:peptide deformylase [Desulfonauticus submarinus]|uniref:Peptide deformylase n=1 Tax=Desulfonauticus submarinus TaxID=206665 RepID=A0A1H0DYX9_9BACT|nr:peptide deformylase [Desulfonauticus submarinus]SDN75236.1 peptide deformylase [Desulfonauticus submarinus]
MSEVLKIITYPNEILTRKSIPIETIDEEIKTLAQNMALTMYENDGIGLAAPQIGQNIRLITVDISGPKKRESLLTLINPEIIYREGEIESEEGCLSVIGYRAKVKRAAKVKVVATNLDKEKIELEAEELLAICLQHEIDHLEGILFIDRISRLKRNLYDKRLKKWLKQRKK